jgi:integrase
MKFTDKGIQALKPQEKRYEVCDSSSRGLRLRISINGTKSWVFAYRREGTLTRLVFGHYPAMSLSAARAKYAEYRQMLSRGIYPAMAEAATKAEALKAPTVAQLVDIYIERYAKLKKKSWRKDKEILDRDIIPRWQHRKACDITRADVIALLDIVTQRGGVMANVTFVVVRKMFNFAIERGLLEVSPCLQVRLPSKAVSRERVLNEGEIVTLWYGLAGISESLQVLLKLMLVTAQRKGELVKAEWDDIQEGWWTMPGHKTKNGKTHRVPLSPLAQQLLSQLPRHSPYLFPGQRKDKPLGDTAVNSAMRHTQGIPNFTPHDLRRTAASHMASMGISRLTISKILNHSDSSVTAIYDRHSYDNEKQHALEAWASKLETLIHPQAKVVSLR